MKVYIELKDGMLYITFDHVPDTEQDRGRVARIDLDLLRKWGRHSTNPVGTRSDGTKKYLFYRERSTSADYDLALSVLRGYCISPEVV